MEIRYRREMRHNYLVIEPDVSPGERYEGRMLLSNKIEGLLRFHMVNTDDKLSFYYEITSRQPLLRLLESRPITRAELSGLILEMAATLERMEAYLLPEEQILLEPEYIYVEPENFRVSFCLVPGSCRSFPQAVGQLLQYLLGNVDHQDKECVVLIYGLYQESQKDNYGMEDLLKLLGRSGGEAPELRTGPEAVGVRQSSGQKQDCGKKQKNGRKQSFDQIQSPDRVKRTAICEYDPVPAERRTPGWRDWGKKIFKTGKKDEEEAGGSGDSWQAFFEEVQETENRKQELSEYEPTTMLLTENKAAGPGYYLQSMQPGNPDIAITEFPFIIGKQSSLADFVLEKETVSRLHVKIDGEGGSFSITDLNSTNGTRVRGRLLDNNETEQLYAGDEVQIAEWRFRFIVGY